MSLTTTRSRGARMNFTRREARNLVTTLKIGYTPKKKSARADDSFRRKVSDAESLKVARMISADLWIRMLKLVSVPFFVLLNGGFLAAKVAIIKNPGGNSTLAKADSEYSHMAHAA